MRIPNRVFSVLAPMSLIGAKMLVSLLSTKSIIDRAGVAFFDAVALILTISSVFFVFNFSFSTRFRRLLKERPNERALHRLYVRTRTQGLFIFACAVIVSFGSVEPTLALLSIAIILICSAYVAPTEYLAGHFHRQTQLRSIEFVLSLVLFSIGFMFDSLQFLILGLFASTPAARLLLLCYYTSYIPISFDQLRPDLRAGRLGQFSSSVNLAAIGNLIQSTAAVTLHLIVFVALPQGSMTAINLSYRFLGPIGAIFNFLSYSTNTRSNLRKNKFAIISLSGFCIVIATLSSVLSARLFPDVQALSFILFFLAGIQVALSGINISISSVLYQEGRYGAVLFAALPFFFAALAAALLVYCFELVNPSILVLITVLASACELCVQYVYLRR